VFICFSTSSATKARDATKEDDPPAPPMTRSFTSEADSHRASGLASA
jgi:hypothetical protein